MRPPRKPRRFRPLTDALERLAPVSSLVSGLAEVGEAVVSANTRNDASSTFSGKTTARPLALAQLVAATAPLSQTRATQHVSRGQGSPTPPTVADRHASLAFPEANMVTFAAASAPSSTAVPVVAVPKPSPSAVPSPSGGIALNATPRTSPSLNPSAAPSAATSPVIIAPSGGVIRPLSLAPPTAKVHSVPNSAFATPAYVSGGGGGGDPPPPNVLVSGGGIGGSGSGSLSLGDVPVGWFPDFSVSAPANWTIDPATIQWSGGTSFSSYFSDPATTQVSQNPALQAVSLGTTVATNKPDYIFIIDSNERGYSVTVNCSYVDPLGGADIKAPATTVTFASVRPTTATMTATGGYQAFYTAGANVVLVYSDNNQPWINGTGLGVVIKADAGAGEFGGDFMFLQLSSKRWAYTDEFGNSSHLSNVGGGLNLDNGYIGKDYGIGMGLNSPPSPSSGKGWSLSPFQHPLSNYQVSDSPQNTDITSSQYITVGNHQFQTYLMYKPAAPTNGVWIALARCDWSWTVSATNTGTADAPVWPAPNATLAPNPSILTPSGAAAFPTWTFDTSDQTWRDGL